MITWHLTDGGMWNGIDTLLKFFRKVKFMPKDERNCQLMKSNQISQIDKRTGPAKFCHERQNL